MKQIYTYILIGNIENCKVMVSFTWQTGIQLSLTSHDKLSQLFGKYLFTIIIRRTLQILDEAKPETFSCKVGFEKGF